MTGRQAKYVTLRGAYRSGVPLPVLRDICRRVRWPKNVEIFGTSLKVEKGDKQGVLTKIFYGAPASQLAWAGVPSQCRYACKGCIKACLGHTAGRMVYDSTRNAQNWKTLLLHYAPEFFRIQAKVELRRHAERAKRLGKIAAARVNGSTDQPDWTWELWRCVPEVVFYDYTKSTEAAYSSLRGAERAVHRTLSLGAPSTLGACLRFLEDGGTVAVVFRTRDPAKFPAQWHGFPVINGDETDIRFRDPRGCVVGLTAKGSAMRDDTGWVQEI